MIPLFHDFEGETVLVLGGGTVGERKARRFAREARVVVVSPSFAGGLESLSREADAGIELVRAAPAPEDVRAWVDRTEPALVVAATDDPETNAAAEAAARERGALINRTDVSGGRDAGGVVVPATVDDDPVRVAVSTGGTSPALARVLRGRIEADIEGAGAMADLSGELREDLKRRGIDPERRRAAVREVVRSDVVWTALREERSAGLREAETVIEGVLRS